MLYPVGLLQNVILRFPKVVNRCLHRTARQYNKHINESKNVLGVEKCDGYPKIGDHLPAAINNVIDGMPRFPSYGSSSGILRGSDYFGTLIFAISGSVTAASCGMDVFGATAIGTITAIGGGTIRDSIILHKQPFWIEEEEYFFMACFVSAIG